MFQNNKQLLQKIGLVLFGIFLFFLFLELGLRLLEVFSGSKTLCIYSADSQTGFVLSPDFKARHSTGEFNYEVMTNSLGFRDKAYDKNKETILALGDSFTFGVGAADGKTFVDIAEKGLSDNSFQIMNLGVPGYGTRTEIDLLKEKGLTLKPKTVLLFFYLGNDFVENLKTLDDAKKEFVIKDHCILPAPADTSAKKSFLSETRYFFYSNFYSARFINNLLKELPFFRGILSKIGITSSMNPEMYVMLKNSQETRNALEKTEERILELKKFSEDNNFTFVVFLIPSDFIIDDKLRQKLAEAYGVNEKLDPDAIPNEFISFLEEKGIDVYYPKKEITDSGGLKLYYKSDAHFNDLGNTVYGNYVARILNEKYLKS